MIFDHNVTSELSSYLCLKCSWYGYIIDTYSILQVLLIVLELNPLIYKQVCSLYIFAMEPVGVGYNALEKCCGYINMPQSMSENMQLLLTKVVKKFLLLR